jgi:hypothetical protein
MTEKWDTRVYLAGIVRQESKRGTRGNITREKAILNGIPASSLSIKQHPSVIIQKIAMSNADLGVGIEKEQIHFAGTIGIGVCDKI